MDTIATTITALLTDYSHEQVAAMLADQTDDAIEESELEALRREFATR